MTFRARSISYLFIPLAIACSNGESGAKDPGPVATGGTASAGSGGANTGGADPAMGGAPPASGGQSTGGTTSDDPTLPGYVLEWSDEFDVDGPPNAEYWHILEWPAGQTNQELQAYINSSDVLRVEGGLLIIEAHHHPDANEDADEPSYTSGRIFGSGKKDILYGRIDVRAKLPAGRGTWPAIWMMPTSPEAYGSWPDSGEIDIMEHVGFDMDVVHSAVHTEQDNWLTGQAVSTSMPVANVSTEFHVYRLDWTEEGIWTYVDDELLFHYPNDQGGSSTWPFDQPFHMIMNIAIGGEWGGQQGIDDSIFPQRMEVDYVRVYKPE